MVLFCLFDLIDISSLHEWGSLPRVAMVGSVLNFGVYGLNTHCKLYQMLEEDSKDNALSGATGRWSGGELWEATMAYTPIPNDRSGQRTVIR